MNLLLRFVQHIVLFFLLLGFSSNLSGQSTDDGSVKSKEDSLSDLYTQNLCEIIWSSQFTEDSAAYWLDKGAKLNGHGIVEYSSLRVGKFLGSAIKKALTRGKHTSIKREYKHGTRRVSPFEAALKYSDNARFVFLLHRWDQQVAQLSPNDPFPFDAKYDLVKRARYSLIDSLLVRNVQFEKARLHHITDISIIKKLLAAGASPNTINVEYWAENVPCDTLKKFAETVYPIENFRVDYDEYFGFAPASRIDSGCLNRCGFKLNQLSGGFFFMSQKRNRVYTALNAGVDPNKNIEDKYQKRYSVGYLLMKQDSFAVSDMEFLIKKGFDINQILKVRSPVFSQGDIVCTPLTYFMIKKQPEITAFLLKNGADLNTNIPTGKQPIFLAIDQNDLPSVKAFIKLGVNLNQRAKYRTSYYRPDMYAYYSRYASQEMKDLLKIEVKAYRKAQKQKKKEEKKKK